MLEEIYYKKSTVKKFREGMLGKYIDDFAVYLQELGYTKKYLRSRLSVIRSLNKWLTKNDINLLHFDEKRINQFIKIRKKETTLFLQRGNGKTLHYFVDFFRFKGVIPKSLPMIQANESNKSVEGIIQAYAKYLDEDKGLCISTIIRNKKVICNFLYKQFRNNQFIPEEITQNVILTHIRKFNKHYEPKTIQVMVSSLRSFLRYLVMIGKLRTEIAECIPAIPHCRASHLPVFLIKSETKKLLSACDRRTKKGCRNYAILLLLLRLGLRACEVINLSLDNINWDQGELDITGKGRKHRVLPLTYDVGNALASYLRYVRPKCLDRHVFIGIRHPYRGLNNSSCISSIVCRALITAGLKPHQMGAHLLRYTAAMETLNNGATLFEIGEILGHNSVDTTAIYTKINVISLRKLAQPWPVK